MIIPDPFVPGLRVSGTVETRFQPVPVYDFKLWMIKLSFSLTFLKRVVICTYFGCAACDIVFVWAIMFVLHGVPAMAISRMIKFFFIAKSVFSSVHKCKKLQESRFNPL